VTTPIELIVSVVAGEDADAEELAALSGRLRDALRETDAESIDVPRGGDVPAGAKGEALQWGTLVVTVLSSGALTGVVETTREWIGRQKHGSVRVKLGDDELELSSAAPADQQRVVEEWLRARAARDDG
jgi:hypothetical protein